MARTRLRIPDMSCGHCEVHIRQALVGLPGFHSLEVDLAGRTAEVDHDEALLPLGRLEEVLAEEDYPVAEAVPL